MTDNKKIIVSVINFILFMIMMHNSAGRKPYNKREQALWKIECELGIIIDIECPVDGGWSQWGPWTPCHGLCDDMGHKQRSRECINPPPSKEGNPCSGISTQTDTCYLANCSVEDFRQLIFGDHFRTEALRQLEVIPALLERCLQLECSYDAVQAALASENTWQLSTETVWNSLQCVKHNIGCPLAGGWGSWGSWSACSALCGQGYSWRLRRCDTPLPSNSYLICEGEPLQSKECEGDQCAVAEHVSRDDTGGVWSNWGEWSNCSELCGIGVHRRKRVCLEKHTPRGSDTWGTHCHGQHDQLQTCINKHCSLDGGWAGWGSWGPCSQSCGTGKRYRIRSCTRPVPSGDGKPCRGARTEIGACYLTPCQSYNHLVATFNGEGFLHYYIQNKQSTLIHTYMRFKPISQYGTLFRRGNIHGPHIRISLQKWHICVDVSGEAQSCNLPRLCSMFLVEPDKWHSFMVSVAPETVYLQIDDNHPNIKGTFPCDPHLPEEQQNFRIGEKFYGVIQEVTVNFMPLFLKIEKETQGHNSLTPFSASNIAYEKPTIEEGFMVFNGQYLCIPCFEDMEEWTIEMTVKSKGKSGFLLLLGDDQLNNWMYLSQQNSRLKLKVATEEFRSEASITAEHSIDEWLDIKITKKRDTNTIEMKINEDERVHIILSEKNERRRRNSCVNDTEKNKHTPKNNSIGLTTEQCHVNFPMCTDEFFFGGIPNKIKKVISESIIPFSGTLAALYINNVLQDLLKFSMECETDESIYVSSRTASISNSYHETFWGKSKQINLTCLHARTRRTPHSAQWFLLNTKIDDVGIHKSKIRSLDDGRILRLMTSGDNEIRGFYTCRAHTNKRTRNIVTYGVVGKALQGLHGPDWTTMTAICSTVILLLFTFGWLIIEGISDLKSGYGFFRDQHLSPEEEAEAICKFIDDNAYLVGSKSAVNLAKTRARNIGKIFRSIVKSDRKVVEPPNKNFMSKSSDESSTVSDIGTLPELPDITTNKETRAVYRCEVSFVSSPRHDCNIDSPKAIELSSSTFEATSPRVLCSRLLPSKRRISPREDYMSWRRRCRLNMYSNTIQPDKINITPLKSECSEPLKSSPGQKILKRFQELK